MSQRVCEEARIADVADQIEAAAKPFRVLDDAGIAVGEVDGRIIIDILIGRDLAP